MIGGRSIPWTPARREISERLRGLAPSLAELYEAALRFAFDPTIPARTRFVAHAIREIKNRLPESVGVLREHPRVQYTQRMDALAAKWERHRLPTDSSLLAPPFAVSTPPSTSGAVVPVSVFRMVSRLVEDHRNSRMTSRNAAQQTFAALVAANPADGSSLEPMVVNWLSSTDWFMRNVHDDGRLESDRSGEDLERHFEVFENTLMGLLAGYFHAVENLDDILDDANG